MNFLNINSLATRMFCNAKGHPDDQKHDWDAEKKYNCVHLNSLFILIKYVTRYVTTQVFRMWLTTFSPLIFGWTTK